LVHVLHLYILVCTMIFHLRILSCFTLSLITDKGMKYQIGERLTRLKYFHFPHHKSLQYHRDFLKFRPTINFRDRDHPYTDTVIIPNGIETREKARDVTLIPSPDFLNYHPKTKRIQTKSMRSLLLYNLSLSK